MRPTIISQHGKNKNNELPQAIKRAFLPKEARWMSGSFPLLANHGTFQAGCWISLCFIVEIPAGASALVHQNARRSFPWHGPWLGRTWSPFVHKIVATPRLSRGSFGLDFVCNTHTHTWQVRKDERIQTNHSERGESEDACWSRLLKHYGLDASRETVTTERDAHPTHHLCSSNETLVLTHSLHSAIW